MEKYAIFVKVFHNSMAAPQNVYLALSLLVRGKILYANGL